MRLIESPPHSISTPRRARGRKLTQSLNLAGSRGKMMLPFGHCTELSEKMIWDPVLRSIITRVFRPLDIQISEIFLLFSNENSRRQYRCIIYDDTKLTNYGCITLLGVPNTELVLIVTRAIDRFRYVVDILTYRLPQFVLISWEVIVIVIITISDKWYKE